MSEATQQKSYPPAYPHGPVEEIAPEVFLVRGSIKLNALMRITRIRAAIRHGGTLTLANPIRLSPAGEAELRALGDVKRIMRLGLHGLDDRYYIETFQPEVWCQPGGTKYPLPRIDVELQASSSLPFPDADVFCFAGTAQPEAALLLRRGNGLLLTCDAIQHYGDYQHNNLPARLLLPWMGFPKTTLVGPLWLKFMTPAGASLQSEFERLLRLEFDALLSAHGSFLAHGAKAGVQAAVERAFART